MTRMQGEKTATSGTRQPHARALAHMDAVEIKVTIRPDQELRAERAMELNEDTAAVRIIYFYDTPQLELCDAGVVLRARLVKGDDDDSTVKFRPVEAAKIAEEWKQLKGFKLEADCVGDRVVCSASLTVLQKRDEIDDVAKGSGPSRSCSRRTKSASSASSTKARSTSQSCVSSARFACCAGS